MHVMIIAVLAIVAAPASAGPVTSRALSMAAGSSALLPWPWQPWVLLSLALAIAWYVAGLVRMRRRPGLARAVGKRQAASFGAGMLVLFLALASPLDSLGDELFSAHMVQHLLLLLVAPPLLVWARPGIAFLWALSARSRRVLGGFWTAAGLGRSAQRLMHPIVVWLLFCGSFAFWHLPGPYQWAVGDEFVHALEHLSFLVTALMFWTLVIEPSGRRHVGYGGTLLLVATAAVVSSLPGALLFLAPRPLYPIHAANAAAWGLSLIEDQEIAGTIMWIPAGFVYLVAIEWIFVRWLRDAGRGTASALRRRVIPPGAALMLAIALAARPHHAAAQVGITADTARGAGGDATRGAVLIQHYGCGACHVIPGITGADGVVGPPLTAIGRRIYLAGLLRNTPENMALWLEKPQSVVPGNAMPDMGMSVQQARDIAAYLSTLQ